MNYKIEITKKKITLENINNATQNKSGAIVLFIGLIREINNNKPVKYIKYLVFEKLFTNIFEKKCINLLKNKTKANIYITQYNGLLKINEINSIIIVTANNRKDAFYICKDLVETLKYNTPVWKKEFYNDGTYKWINV